MIDTNTLALCPFCGAGTTEIRENGKIWLGMKYGEPASVSVFHHCDGPIGQPHRAIERIGKDLASAIAAWNRRASAPASQPTADNRVMLDQWERDGELKARAWGAMLEQEQEIVRLEKELQALKTQPAGLPAEPVATYMGHRHTPAGTQEFWGVAVQPMPEGTALFTAAQVQALLAQGLAPGWQAVPVDLDDEIAEAIAMTANCCGGGAYDIWRAALAAAPSRPAREPLTDEQIQEIISKLDPLFLDTPQGFETDFARVIERAHGITAAQNGGQP